MRETRGAAGVERTTIAQIEAQGVDAFLDELAVELRKQRYRPRPVRRVHIPKPGRSETRPLGIPAVKDRVVQTAAKIVIEPIFEADFRDCSFGFGPARKLAGGAVLPTTRLGRNHRPCGPEASLI